MQVTYKTEFESQSFIAGDFQTYIFHIVDENDGSDVDLSNFQELSLVIFNMGDENNPRIYVKGTRLGSDPSRFTVYLMSEYTRDLEGYFRFQVKLIDNNGKEFRPAQGSMNILPRGAEENSEKQYEAID